MSDLTNDSKINLFPDLKAGLLCGLIQLLELILLSVMAEILGRDNLFYVTINCIFILLYLIL